MWDQDKKARHRTGHQRKPWSDRSCVQILTLLWGYRQASWVLWAAAVFVPEMRRRFLLMSLGMLNHMIFIRWLIEFVTHTLINFPHYFGCFCFCLVIIIIFTVIFNFVASNFTKPASMFISSRKCFLISFPSHVGLTPPEATPMFYAYLSSEMVPAHYKGRISVAYMPHHN